MKSGRLPVTENMNGLSIGVSQARPLPGELPFFYEYGVDVMAVFGDHNSTLVSAIVPVSLMYQLDLGQIQLLPFAGLNLTAHILGQASTRASPATGSSQTTATPPPTASSSAPS